MHSSGPGIDIRTIPKSDFGEFRGKIAGSHTLLVDLINVGGGVFHVGKSLSDIPFARCALGLLNQDPLQGHEPNRESLECRVVKRWPRHVEYLIEVGVLQNFYSVWKSEYVPTPILSEYTAVMKANGQARAILDMRQLNALCTLPGVPFSVLGVGQFLDVLRRLEPSKFKLKAIHADISNAYYQIPIGNKRCCVAYTDRILQAAVLPMGYEKSCGICQALVWGLVEFKYGSTIASGNPT